MTNEPTPAPASAPKPINAAHSGAIIDMPSGIRWFQFVVRRAALRIEAQTGMRRRGRPIMTIIRQAYGLDGRSRRQMLVQVNELYDQYADRPDDFIRDYPADGQFPPSTESSVDFIRPK